MGEELEKIAELAALIGRMTGSDGGFVPLDGVHLYRQSAQTEPVHGLYEASLCVVAQGRKELLLGGEPFVYDPDSYLLVSAALPVSTRVIAASPDRPCLCVGLPLDAALVRSVLVEAGQPAGGNGLGAVRALDVGVLEPELLDAVVRIIRLLDSPEHARMLIPLAMREIVYRLLVGGQGARLRQIAVSGSKLPHVAGAIEWLRLHFDQPLGVEALAAEVGMSTSGLRHHFKAVTALSPLQFQKQLRLQEARRLMVSGGLDAAGAGFRVGYDDPSHFSREYRRMFGAPPRRDVTQMRNSLAGVL